MTKKVTETYTYDEFGKLVKKETRTEETISTQWYPYPIPAYQPIWDTTPRWLGHPVVSNTDTGIRDVVDPYHG